MYKPTAHCKLLVACALIAGLLAAGSFSAGVASAAEPAPITAATLVDRAMIEDLLVDYYANLGGGKHGFARWFTADGRLDVNGEVGQGAKGIEDIYKATAVRNAARKGTFRMVLSNLRIVVNGDTATADCIWTGLNSETVTSPTVVVEQGREHAELAKQNGRWLFRNRIITSDGGMPPELLKTYKKR